ncbi:UNKNOWN [Stylonychia lemnae]|uniref:Uncharacterized protein n=1 Tax=Stylonychia lemnae TaxID=5949 RepID=A0A078A5G4_STYLE|nr:UNKNOWN [Stylonychia lemnae]|eukprot:CDW77134.1 UNKNOWN [Stylonychia lemnae]
MTQKVSPRDKRQNSMDYLDKKMTAFITPINQRAKSILHTRQAKTNKNSATRIQNQQDGLVFSNALNNRYDSLDQQKESSQGGGLNNAELHYLNQSQQSLEFQINENLISRRHMLSSAPDPNYLQFDVIQDNEQNEQSVQEDGQKQDGQAQKRMHKKRFLYTPVELEDDDFMFNLNEPMNQSMHVPNNKNNERKFNLRKFRFMKRNAEKEKAEKKLTIKEELDSIMNRLENVDAKDLRAKLKNLIDDSQQQRNLIEVQRNHNQIKNQILGNKYKSPKDGGIQNLTESSFDFDNQSRSAVSSVKYTEVKKQLPIQQSLMHAYQLRMKRQQEEEQKRKMVDLKLNYMISNLQERLGFVTKKQKMDHFMNRLATNIEKKVKTSNKTNSENESSIKKQEYDIRSPLDSVNDYENYADNLLQPDFNRKTKSHFTKLNKVHSKSSLDQNRIPSQIREHSMNQPNTTKYSQFKQGGQKYLNFQHPKTTQVSPRESARSQANHSSIQNSNRFKSMSPKHTQNQLQQNFTDNMKLIKEKILDKNAPSPRVATDYYNFEEQNLVMEFLQSLYADKDWTSIATDEQFEKIMQLMSEYYGMNENFDNKYSQLPRFLLAKKQQKSQSKQDVNHIGAEDPNLAKSKSIKGKSLKGSQKMSLYDKDEDIPTFHVFSDDEEDHGKKYDDKEFEKHIKQMHLDSEAMKERFVMERYTSYLNKCMFIASDDYIKRKFKAFLEKKNPQKSDNFFKRMQKDQELRNQKEKIIQDLKEGIQNQLLSLESAQMTGMIGSITSKLKTDLTKYLGLPGQQGTQTNQNNQRQPNSRQSDNSVNVFSDHVQNENNIHLQSSQPSYFKALQELKNNKSSIPQLMNQNSIKANKQVTVKGSQNDLPNLNHLNAIQQQFKRSHMRMLHNQRLTEKMQGSDIISQKIVDLEMKILSKKQNSPVKIKFQLKNTDDNMSLRNQF